MIFKMSLRGNLTQSKARSLSVSFANRQKAIIIRQLPYKLAFKQKTL